MAFYLRRPIFEEFDPDATYSVAASELIAGGGRAVGSEPEALAWFLAR